MKQPLPRHLTVPYIIANATTTIAYDSAQENTLINKYLVENGVILDDENDTSAERQAAHIVLTEHPSFWVKHWSLHPNKNRCKKWMRMQDRFRRKMDIVVSKTNNLPLIPTVTFEGDAKTSAASAVKRLLRELHTFEKSFFAHLEFEKLVMFPFFIYEKNQARDVKDALNNLIENHTELEVSDEIYSPLEHIVSDSDSYNHLKETVSGNILQYAENLEIHLNEKEEIIVGILLRLNHEQYKYYRKHIPWKYKIRY